MSENKPKWSSEEMTNAVMMAVTRAVHGDCPPDVECDDYGLCNECHYQAIIRVYLDEKQGDR